MASDIYSDSISDLCWLDNPIGANLLPYFGVYNNPPVSLRDHCLMMNEAMLKQDDSLLEVLKQKLYFLIETFKVDLQIKEDYEEKDESEEDDYDQDEDDAEDQYADTKYILTFLLNTMNAQKISFDHSKITLDMYKHYYYFVPQCALREMFNRLAIYAIENPNVIMGKNSQENIEIRYFLEKQIEDPA